MHGGRLCTITPFFSSAYEHTVSTAEYVPVQVVLSKLCTPNKVVGGKAVQ